MSGGHFGYREYSIRIIIEDLEELISTNNGDYPPIVINKFKNAIKTLKMAYVYAHRIDYLLSGDDGTESFLKRLKEELKELR